MTNQEQTPGRGRRWRRRAAAVAVGVVVTGVLGATAAQASTPSPTAASGTITVDGEWRLMKGWTSESVPAYSCPADHPYLTKDKYAPDFTTLPPGLEILESPWDSSRPWPIGVSITGWELTPDPRDPQHWSLITGTKTGALNSSATNWLTTDAYYKVRLHCTDDLAEAGRR